MPLITRNSNIAALYSQTRALCESIYYVLLLGYQTGLEAFYNRSIERSKANKGQGRMSTPKWHNALSLSKEATRMALLAHTQWEDKKIELSISSAEKAVELIAKSVEEAPPEQEKKKIVLIDHYSEELANQAG